MLEISRSAIYRDRHTASRTPLLVCRELSAGTLSCPPVSSVWGYGRECSLTLEVLSDILLEVCIYLPGFNPQYLPCSLQQTLKKQERQSNLRLLHGHGTEQVPSGHPLSLYRKGRTSAKADLPPPEGGTAPCPAYCPPAPGLAERDQQQPRNQHCC